MNVSLQQALSSDRTIQGVCSLIPITGVLTARSRYAHGTLTVSSQLGKTFFAWKEKHLLVTEKCLERNG
jgi:hypothetical protein